MGKKKLSVRDFAGGRVFAALLIFAMIVTAFLCEKRYDWFRERVILAEIEKKEVQLWKNYILVKMESI